MANSSERDTASRYKYRGSSGILVAILVASAASVTALPAAARPTARSVSAHAARTLNADDTAHLHLLRASGSLLLEEGSASGGITGSMRASLEIGATFVGSFTIYTRHGNLKGHGSATPHGSGRYESFSGSVVATGGSGLYTHVHGRVGFYGTFDRKTYALVVQTTGKLSY